MEPLPPTLFKALCDAALHGDVDTIRHLMATEPNFIELLQTPNELTPLHFAATQGHTEIIQLLLDYYAANAQSDVQSFINNQNNPSKTSPLHWQRQLVEKMLHSCLLNTAHISMPKI